MYGGKRFFEQEMMKRGIPSIGLESAFIALHLLSLLVTMVAIGLL